MGSLLSSVPFASLLVYSPRGQSDVSRRSCRVRDAIKSGDRGTLERAARRIVALGATAFGEFLGADVTLVPAPRSSPFREAGALWPSERICAQLVTAGLGQGVLACLGRTEAVPKSAFAGPGDRPSVQRHFETMEVERSLLRPSRITVVDDVVTKGATLLAAVSRVAEAFPDADVRAFALLRTMGLVPEIEQILAPCTGTITFRNGEAVREP